MFFHISYVSAPIYTALNHLLLYHIHHYLLYIKLKHFIKMATPTILIFGKKSKWRMPPSCMLLIHHIPYEDGVLYTKVLAFPPIFAKIGTMIDWHRVSTSRCLEWNPSQKLTVRDSSSSPNSEYDRSGTQSDSSPNPRTRIPISTPGNSDVRKDTELFNEF